VATIAFVVHPANPEAPTIAARAERWLVDRGHAVVRVTDDEDGAARPRFAEGLDLAVSLGGDGTMLRTVALACAPGIPVLGVNLGRLGYLTEVEPSGVEAALERFLAGDYVVEERITLEVDIESGPPGVPPASATGGRPVATAVVLNEAVVEKTAPGHTIRVRASIGGRPLATYAADGLLVATPTGSTAYNLSARGPILSPGLRAIVLTPVSAHMLFDRPVVLEPEQWVRLDIEGPRPAVLVLDGETAQTLEPGDAVVCRVGPTPARFVTFGPRDFFSILRARFHLADR
jgi:NAD+ kinase